MPRVRTGALMESVFPRPRTMPRLSDLLSDADARDFRSIATLPSNIEAVEAALLFSAGRETLVAVVGPSGWGKSRLLDAAASRLRAETGMEVPLPIDAEDWLAAGSRRALAGFAIVDNVQTCIGSMRQRQALRVLLERRVKSRRPTLLSFTAPGPCRQIRSLLPQAHEWRVAHLKEPSASERELVLRQMSVFEGPALSDRLGKLLARLIKGNGRTLSGALKRLKLQQNRWMTPSETLRACGLLTPFFADNSSWDLREHIVKVVARQATERPELPVDPLSASAYLMLREAMLSEDEVAAYLKMQPKEAYAMAGRVEQKRTEDPRTALALTRLISDIVRSLHED